MPAGPLARLRLSRRCWTFYFGIHELTITFRLEGSAIHNGGSCQLSISEDGGSSWKVIKSFMGNCPASAGGVSMSVTIPKDVKSGDVLFAWTWNNNTGNREFYMNW